MAVPLSRTPAFLGFGIPVVLLLTILAIGRWSTKKLDALEKERVHMQRGATGEALVSAILQNFPDEFYITNNLSTPFGDLDHVVVGPTGVFIIDTKDWRGIVAPDGKGELFLNDKPTEKRFVNGFVARMMKVKDRVDVLAGIHDSYFQPVFVFTSARVDVDWGTTGNVHCIREDQLFEYVVQSAQNRKLTDAQVQVVAQAFVALASLDSEFERRPSPITTEGRWPGATMPLPGLRPATAAE
jgi:hypothetical protein